MSKVTEELEHYKKILNNIGEYKIINRLLEAPTQNQVNAAVSQYVGPQSLRPVNQTRNPVSQPQANAVVNQSMGPQSMITSTQTAPQSGVKMAPKEVQPGQFHRGDLSVTGMSFGQAFKDSKMRGYDSFYWRKNGKLGEYETIMRGQSQDQYLKAQEAIRTKNGGKPLDDSKQVNSAPAPQTPPANQPQQNKANPDEKAPENVQQAGNKQETPPPVSDAEKLSKIVKDPKMETISVGNSSLDILINELKSRVPPSDLSKKSVASVALRAIIQLKMRVKEQQKITMKNVIDALDNVEEFNSVLKDSEYLDILQKMQKQQNDVSAV